MRNFLIKLGLILTLTVGCVAQNTADATFSITKSTTLSGTAEVLTLFHPNTSNRYAKFQSLYAYCAVACTVTLERGGTPSAGTAVTVVNVNPANPLVQTSTCTATSGTTVSSTVVINAYNIAAGGFISLSSLPFSLPVGTADSLTLRTSAVTGAVVLQQTWNEL